MAVIGPRSSCCLRHCLSGSVLKWWFSPQVDENDEDKGQRAVRDTQDTVEVMLLHKCDDEVHLMPWVGDERVGVANGAVIPTNVIPDDAVAKIAAQCSVRLPMGLCLPDKIDSLIAALEDGCASEAACWQESPWLAGKLALFLHEEENGFVSSELCGHVVAYSREAGLYAEGKNFFETLMLNWVLYDTKYDSERYRLFGNEQDIPVWEQDEVSSSDLDNQSTFAGPVQAMTWQSRRLRLVPNEEGTRIVGVVSCYGDVVAPYNTDGFEKMTAWRKSIPQQKKLGLPAPPHMPVMHDASKALWRGLEPILCVKDDSDFRPGLVRWLEEIRTEMLDSGDHVLNLVTLHAQGMTYGTQSSVFETGIDDTLSLNTVMFRHDYAGIAAVVDAVKCTDNAVQALVQFVRNLRTSAGDKSKSTETAEQIRESVYADLDGLFRDRLAAFDESNDPIEYSNDWKDEVHHRLLEAGQSYLEQSPVPVFDEHEAGVMGVMNAARAQLLFRSKLNKELGSLTREIPVHSDKGGK